MEADAIQFWADTNRLPKGVSAEERAKELVCIGYHEGRVFGLTTAQIGMYELVRHKLAFWRILVHPDFRSHGMQYALTNRMIEYFEQWSRERPEEELAGLASVQTGNTYVNTVGHDPVVIGSRSVMINYNSNNDIVRVRWFDHIRV